MGLGAVFRMKILAVILIAVAAGCVHRPGESWPYVTRSFYEGDVIYNGVGVTW